MMEDLPSADAPRPRRCLPIPNRLAVSIIVMLLPCARAAGESPASQSINTAAFQTDMARLAETALAERRLTVAGRDDWLFHAGELRFLGLDTFWGERAAQVSRATNPAYADPIPAIVSFHRDLQDRGIDLLLLPVPAKASIYADQLLDAATPTPLFDLPLHRFYDLLRREGVNLLDLAPVFIEARRPGEDPVYCRTDSHWSPRGCRIAAEQTAAWIRDRPWFESGAGGYSSTAERREIRGDLADGAPDPPAVSETLTFYLVGDAPIPSDPESPVILMGDSHTLVYQDGQLHGAQAGLADHLAAALGYPLDLQFRNKGSGSTQVRLDLFRRQLQSCKTGGDYLAGKRAIVWCFTVREFSESTAGWRPLPLEK